MYVRAPFWLASLVARRLSLLPFLSLHRFGRDPRPEGRCRARGGLGDGQKQLQGCGKTKSGASGGGKSSQYIQQGAIGWGSGGGRGTETLGIGYCLTLVFAGVAVIG